MTAPLAPGGSVLLVEDDPDLRSVLAVRLRGTGLEVAEAADGRTGLERVEAGQAPDLVILDVMMPGMDGFEVLDRLQTLPDPPAVILLTALGARENRLHGLANGAVDYVVKPFDPEELLARIGAALRERRRLAAVRAAALSDPLTGLANRRAFEADLTAETARATRYGRPLSLVAADADGLKRVNDTWGHGAGDAYLRAIARGLRSSCRGADRPYRVGGDEFAVLLPETDESGARQFIARLRAVLGAAERFASQCLPAAPSVSAGFAVLGEEDRDGRALVEAADRALYRAKSAAHAPRRL